MSNPSDSFPLGPEPAPTLPDTRPGLGEQVAEIAAAVAELRAASTAEQVLARRSRRLQPLETALIILLGASLLLHALTIARLLGVRNTLRAEIASLADGVAQAKTSQVQYTVPIDQQLPIDIDVPIKRSLDVPINTAVRIQQTVNLPVETALGNFTIPVPIDANVPISTTVPIVFDQTVTISTTVPIKLDIPVQLDLGSEQLAPLLDRLRQRLIELRDEL